jgi:hypothetical protein
MKYITTIILIGIFSCNSNKWSDRNETHEKLISDYLDSLSNKSLGESFLAENFMHYGPMIIDSIGRAEWIQLGEFSIKEDFYLMKVDKYSIHSKNIKEGKMKGDWVFVWGKLTGKFLADKPVITVWYNWSFKIENNKIVEERVTYDNLDVLRQEGFKLDLKPDSIYTAITRDSTIF